MISPLVEFWTASFLGLAGSIHCAAMCGPLTLALPANGYGRVSFVVGRLAYNCGRITTYCLLGMIFGSAGKTFALAGFQRWLSLAAGSAILLGLAFTYRSDWAGVFVARIIARLKSSLSRLMRKRSSVSLFVVGLLNGLLPCGLVYVACAGAVAQAELMDGMIYMAVFGLSTVPMMLGIGLAGKGIQVALRLRLQRLVPIAVTIVGALLMLRGLSLGIPYISPDLSRPPDHCAVCADGR